MLNYSSSKYTISPTPDSGINPDVIASGAGAGSLVTANTNTAGQLGIGLINATWDHRQRGICHGHFHRASSARPTAPGDFTVVLVPAPAVFSNTTTRTQIVGASVAISSVTIK